MLRCEIQKQDLLIAELRDELLQKKRGLNNDLVTAKSEAAMMLQSHGIMPGNTTVDSRAQEGNAKSKASLQSQSQGNLFNKKKENLEDKARILELIQMLEENN